MMKANYKKAKKPTKQDFENVIRSYLLGTLSVEEEAYFFGFLHSFIHSDKFGSLNEESRAYAWRLYFSLQEKGYSIEG